MATIVQTEQAQVIAAYEEVIECLKRIKGSISMHAGYFKEANQAFEKKGTWPKSLFIDLTSTVNTQIGKMLDQAKKLGKGKLAQAAAKQVENLAGRVSGWYSAIMKGELGGTEIQDIWGNFTGATLENFLETVREDFVKMAVEDKENKETYIELNKNINALFDKFRQEPFKAQPVA